MVHAFIQDVPIGEDVYGRIVAEMGSTPMPGLLMHLCVRRPEGGLRYIDVWEDEASCARAFDEVVHPAVDAAFAGHRPPEPVVQRLDVVDVRGSLLPEELTPPR